jgi:hypothetical protein
MTNNKKVNILLSVILSVILWAYVINEANPMTTKVFKDVPITYLNTDIMEENGYAILSSEIENVNVTVRGQRSALNTLNAEDITVTADMIDVAKGENEVELNVLTPNNITLDGMSKRTLNLVIENRVVAEFESEIVFKNLSNEQEEPIIIEQAKTMFEVSGAETLVETVSNLQIEVDAKDIDDEMRTLKVTAYPVSSNGTIIRNLTVTEPETTVTVVNCKTKTVKLNVNVINNEDGIYQRTYKASKTITIKGYDEYLEETDSIGTEPINISYLTESQVLEIVPVLSENLYVADISEGLKLNVTVEKYIDKSFDLSNENILIKNLGEGLTYSTASQNFTARVRATDNVLSSLNQDSFTLTIDAAELKKGTYYLEVIPNVDGDVYSVNVIPSKIKVEIK